MKDYIKEWNRFGYENIVQKFRNVFVQDKLQQLIDTSFLSEKRQKALFRLICKRDEELWDT